MHSLSIHCFMESILSQFNRACHQKYISKFWHQLCKILAIYNKSDFTSRRASTGWLIVRIIGLSGISGHGAGGLVSQVGHYYKVAMSAHCHTSVHVLT